MTPLHSPIGKSCIPVFMHQLLAGVALAACSVLAHAQPTTAPARGELLYSTHCVTCHTTQMHWRNDRQAFDWDSLKFQVRRWQGNAGLAWSEADIAEVSRFLNETIYHYPQLNDRVGLIAPQKIQPKPTNKGQ
jgi:mono/diheme cytochrome c family protein